MLRYLLLVMALSATCMGLSQTILCRKERSLEAAEVPLDENEAKAILEKSNDFSKIFSSMNLQSVAAPLGVPVQPGAAVGKGSPHFLFGSTISSQPALSCPRYQTTHQNAQELCPSGRVKVHTLSSPQYGFCYILFPHWQNIYESRCLCPRCRLNCSRPSWTWRHTCVRDPKPYSYKKVWAICYKSRSWQIRNFTHKLSNGKCSCKTYYRRSVFDLDKDIFGKQC